MKHLTKQPKKNQQLNFDITKFTFLRDLVLVKEIRPEMKGLVDPHSYEEKPEFGTVVRLGKEVKDIKVGDIVRFGKYSTEAIRMNNEDFYIIHTEDISAVLK